MTNMTTPLYVAYGSDDNYAKYLGISMLSLFQRNAEFEQIVVFVLDCGISDENKQRLQGIADAWQRQIHFINMSEAIGSLNLNLGAHKIAIASYARLFLASILPEDCDRVLYIDCDTLVRDSLAPLWATSFGNALIAGAQDTVDSYFLEVIGLPKGTKYVNAGVLLINLKAWREENLQEQFLQTIAKFGGNVPHHDQGTINSVCKERRVIVPIRYNLTANIYSFSAATIRKIYFLEEYYTQEELDAAMAKPAIVHFTTGLLGRPWEEKSTHPEQKAFWDTVEQTPWKGMERKPDSRRFGLKAFIFFHKITPRPIFEFVYRNISWALHLRK